MLTLFGPKIGLSEPDLLEGSGSPQMRLIGVYGVLQLIEQNVIGVFLLRLRIVSGNASLFVFVEKGLIGRLFFFIGILVHKSFSNSSIVVLIGIVFCLFLMCFTLLFLPGIVALQLVIRFDIKQSLFVHATV